jgi:formate--tetrahydrofolate ligase
MGGEGAIELATMIVKAVKNSPEDLKTLYDLDWSFDKKIETIATKMYGADHIEYTVLAKQQLKSIEELGLGDLAVCIAKTQKSLSDNENKKGCPKGFTFKITEIELSSGAGFIVPIAGTIMRMPGLPSNPSAEKIDIDENGRISGLF